LIESESKKVINFMVVEKTMVEYSSKMEAWATKALLIQLLDKQVKIRVLTTDRSPALKSLMKEVNQERKAHNDPAIKHCFDSWHFGKSIAKDIWKAAKLSKCISLSCWLKSVKNQIYFGIVYCGGNAEMLREIILSIPLHCAGVHEFPNNSFFKKCAHGPLPEGRAKPYLKVGSLPYKKLERALRGHNDSRLKDLEHLTEIQHTSVNEQLNNLHNIYAPKHTFFGHEQATVRGCLSAIDHNCNVNRPAKKEVDGDDKYERKKSRDGQHYSAKKVKVAKDTRWRAEILAEVVEAVRTHTEPTVKIPTFDNDKIYGKKLPVPDLADVVAATKAKSRFRYPSKQ